MSMDPYLWWFYAFWASRALAGAVETGSEVGAAFRGVDQASSVLFAASAQDQDTRFQAPWHLDRIDQADLPLDGQFQTQVPAFEPALNWPWSQLFPQLAIRFPRVAEELRCRVMGLE